jgi:hypothetical protein
VSNRRLFITALLGWPVTILLVFALRESVLRPALSAPEYAGWVFLACAPLLIALMIASGRSTGSIAQTIYDAERAAAGIRKPVRGQSRD